MKRRLAVLLAVAVAVTMALSSCSSPAVKAGPTALERAYFKKTAKPLPTPHAKFTRTTWVTTQLSKSDFMLNFCRGPISIFLGDARPVLVAEHDFCGGLGWIPKLAQGDAVKLSGDGVVPGTYVVTSIGHARRGHAKVRDLPDADVVLQTCVSPERLVLVGAKLFDPTPSPDLFYVGSG